MKFGSIAHFIAHYRNWQKRPDGGIYSKLCPV